MGLFQRKPAFDPNEYIGRIREYIRIHQEELRKQGAAEPGERPGDPTQFSLAGQSEEGDALLQMIRNADTPEAKEALTEKYLEWEKEKAIRSSFSKRVQDWLVRKRMRPAEFYKAAGIGKRTFSKLKNDYLYQPSRDTAIRCCFGLRLKCPEALSLLRLGGFALSLGDSRDLVIRFCLEQELYDVKGVNALLELMDEKPF